MNCIYVGFFIISVHVLSRIFIDLFCYIFRVKLEGRVIRYFEMVAGLTFYPAIASVIFFFFYQFYYLGR